MVIHHQTVLIVLTQKCKIHQILTKMSLFLLTQMEIKTFSPGVKDFQHIDLISRKFYHDVSEGDFHPLCRYN